MIRPNLVKRVLPDILSDSNLIDVPEPIVNASVVLNTRFSSVPSVLLSAVENPLTPVRFAPSPLNDVAVTLPLLTFILPPVTFIPDLAVMTPIESTFATSS